MRREEFEFADLPGRRSADPLGDRTGTSSLRVVELERTTGRTAHRHPHSEEIIYVEAGEGEIWIDGSLHALAPGDVVLIPAGAAHGTLPTQDSMMRLVCFFPRGELGDNYERTDIVIEGRPDGSRD